MSIPETLILTRRDVAALLTLDEAIEAVERAFLLHAQGKTRTPGILGVPAVGGGFHVKAAGIELSRTYVAVKTNSNFPANPERFGLPAIQGVVVLADGDDGMPLAVMDSIEITSLRTGAATALAARLLARRDADVAAICGCGTQGRVQLRALSRVRSLQRAFAFDADPERSRSFAAEMTRELGVNVEPVSDAAAAARRSDLCVTCTPSRQPLLRRGDVPRGAFVAGVGADSSDKNELDPALLASSAVVVDVLKQCAEIGDLRHAIAAGLMTRADVRAELAEVVAGSKPGRASDDEVVVFDSTGTALEDVAAAAAVYEKAVERGAGLRVELAR